MKQFDNQLSVRGFVFLRCFDEHHVHSHTQVELKQDELSSSKRELEEERELLQRGKREAASEADNLDRRREVREVKADEGHRHVTLRHGTARHPFHPNAPRHFFATSRGFGTIREAYGGIAIIDKSHVSITIL